MTKDITKIISSLRDTAVGKCRDRIEQAAKKTKCVFTGQSPIVSEETKPPCTQDYGVTTLLKRRHGL